MASSRKNLTAAEEAKVIREEPIVQICPFCATASMQAKPYVSKMGRGYTFVCIRCNVRMFLHVHPQRPVGLLAYRRVQRFLQDPQGREAYVRALESYDAAVGPIDAVLPGNDVIERIEAQGLTEAAQNATR